MRVIRFDRIVSVVGLFLFSLPGAAGAADACEPLAGRVVSVQGDVEVQRAQDPVWRPASLEEPLCAGDLVRVGDAGRAAVALINETVLRIDRNSSLRLIDVSEKNRSVVYMLQGAAHIFSRTPRAFEINTRFVTAMVEGTEFLVRVDPDQALVSVFEGRVEAANSQGRLSLTNGQSAVAHAGAAPAPYVLVRPREAVQWMLYYPPVLTALTDRSGKVPSELPEPLRAAIALGGRGDLRGAFDRLATIPESDRGPEFHLYRAALLLSVGRVDEARQDIDQALAQDPNAGLAYALRAAIAVAQNDEEQVLKDAQRAVDLSPREAAAKIALSYAEQASFRLEAARKTLQKAVEDEPANALAWARLSELWLMLDYRDRAREAAEKAASLAPDLERTQTVLGFAALAEFRARTARKAFQRAIALDSANPLPRFGLGLARIRESDLEKGREDIEIAVGLDPNSALLRSYLGKAHFEERRPGLAGDQFAIAKELDPLDPTPWFYDAILKQSENRPVEALRDLQKSIALNDNRAVYRSRALLDQDRAARGTSLGRVYDDLGFQQLGLNEATKSLTLDPANASAHRFLSDTYTALPRREIARVSELLQAQLLQDININPIQPSLSETNVTIITDGGPARPGFNEFTPLFERNRAQLNVSGEIGNNDTWADEVVVSGLYDRFSLSAGQFHYTTDGFRKNFDLQHDIYDLFAQAALTPEFNVQAEFRRRRTEEGDPRLNFDPEDFARARQRDLDQDTSRIGVRFTPSSSSALIASLIRSDRDEDQVDVRATNHSLQGEGQYLLEGDFFTLITGLGIYDVHRRDQIIFLEEPTRETTHSRIKHGTAYVYSNIEIVEGVIGTLGFSYDDYEEENLELRRLNPKVGLLWDITPSLRLRLAGFRTVKPLLATNQTIQPTQLAGFNQFFDDLNGTEAWRYGVGLDAAFTENLFAGVEVSRRNLQEPVSIEENRFEDRDETLYRAHLYWTPHREWAMSGELRMDTYDSEQPSTRGGLPSRLETWSTPISVRYFNPLGLFGGFGATLVHQDVTRRGVFESEGNNSFVVVDAAVGFRFPQRRGLIGLEVRNLFNNKFKFQDDSFREFEDEPTVSPFIPERTILGRLMLNF